MKKLFFSILTVLLFFTGAHAQRLVIGEKAPEIRVERWLEGRESALNGKVLVVDFFHSSNDQCISNLSRLNDLQNRYGEKLNVIVLSREEEDKINRFFSGKGYRFYIGLDHEGKTFDGYGVRFVPFTVLIDGRGRLVWTGNITGLSDDIIRKVIN